MTATSPSAQQLTAHVDMILERHSDAKIVGIRSPSRRDWPAEVRHDGQAFRVVWCETPLAAREAVIDSASETEGLVLVTALDEKALGTDLVARMARRRLETVDPWQIVEELFHAQSFDPRLDGKRWIAETLLELAPADGFSPVSGGLLDAETVWHHLLELAIGLTPARPGVSDLLGWTTGEDGPRRYGQLSRVVQDGIAEYLSETAGHAGSLIMACAIAGHAAMALPIGLALKVIHSQEGEPKAELVAASARLEFLTQGQAINAAAAWRWIEGAETVVRSLDERARHQWLESGDALLQQIQAQAYAWMSDLSPRGFDERLRAFANTLQSVLQGKESDEALANAAALCERHILRESKADRIQRLHMAVRLARWLRRSADDDPASLPALADVFAKHSAFSDYCRRLLSFGDELEELAKVYGDLTRQASDRRELENRTFATALIEWNKGQASPDSVIHVEDVIERAVGPIASAHRMLLLVVDGLSLPIFRELFSDIGTQGWTEFVPESAMSPMIGVAAFPTVTEVSRTSLLSGKLARGTASTEKTAFAQHARLLTASKPSKPPVLYHKGDLSDQRSGGLPAPVRSAIAAMDQAVVGVVFNAVDDQLSGSSQLNVRWRIADLPNLSSLLQEARNAGRIVIVTADHGHTLDNGGTVLRNHDEGDRWRRADGAAGDDEILLSGGRTLAPNGADGVILAWSERVRYASKKNGYHGGASPQEVLVPLSVFAQMGVEIDGWVEAPPLEPDWWTEAPPSEATPRVPRAVISEAPAGPQIDMFGTDKQIPPEASEWIEHLLQSDLWSAQVRLVGRAAPQQTAVQSLLQSLQSRGWKASYVTLAQAAGVPAVRVRGMLSGLRRVLNVDGVPVLILDEREGFAELNTQLMANQFHIERP